jgi:hypothetical protein
MGGILYFLPGIHVYSLAPIPRPGRSWTAEETGEKVLLCFCPGVRTAAGAGRKMLSPLAFHERLQGRGIIQFLLFGGKEKGDRSLPCFFGERIKLILEILFLKS